MNNATNARMTIQEKARIKRALIQSGVNSSGMDDNELLAAYADLNAREVTKPEPKETPKREKAEEKDDKEAEKAPKKERKAPKHDTKTRAQVTELLGSAIDQIMRDSLNEERVIELITEHAGQPDLVTVEVKERGETRKIDGLAHKQLADVIKWLSVDASVYLAGPAGSGKTTIARQCAEALGVDFYFSGAIFHKYELLGFIDAGGTYQETDFRRAFECGGVFLFDEIDASEASALVAFNAAIANRVCSFPDKMVNAHPDFRVIAAANTRGKGATREYTGRNPLDAATLDRYAIIDIDYDQGIEAELARRIHLEVGGDNVTGVDDIVKTVQDARARAVALSLSCVISPRASIDAAKGLAAGFTIQEALKAALWNKLDATSAKQLGGL